VHNGHHHSVVISSKGRKAFAKKIKMAVGDTLVLTYKNKGFKMHMNLSDTSMELLLDCKRHARRSVMLRVIFLLLPPKL
jgi:hypothetical protein